MTHIYLFFSNESIPNSETTGYCSGSSSSTPEKPSAKTSELTHSTERILSMRPSNSPPLPTVGADEDRGDILSRFPLVDKKHSSVRTSPNRPTTSPELRPSSNIFSHITNQQSVQSPILGSSPPSVGSSFGQFGHLGSSATAGGAPGLSGFVTGLGHLGQNLGLSPANPLHAFQIQQFMAMQRLANATILGQMNPNLLRVSSPLTHPYYS